jgi:hypothetical protein
MIARDSTSYPVLAVIQHNHLDGVEKQAAYDFAQELREWLCASYRAAPIAPPELPMNVVCHLFHNMSRTAMEHKWL